MDKVVKNCIFPVKKKKKIILNNLSHQNNSLDIKIKQTFLQKEVFSLINIWNLLLLHNIGFLYSNTTVHF